MGLALAFVPGRFEVDLGSVELVLFSCLLASLSHALLGTGAAWLLELCGGTAQSALPAAGGGGWLPGEVCLHRHKGAGERPPCWVRLRPAPVVWCLPNSDPGFLKPKMRLEYPRFGEDHLK